MTEIGFFYHFHFFRSIHIPQLPGKRCLYNITGQVLLSQDFHAPAVTCIGQQVISEVSREEDRAARSLFKAEPHRPGRTGCELVRQLPQGSGQDKGLVGRHEQIACRIRIQIMQ